MKAMSDAASPYLASAPPPWAARALAGVLLALFTVATLALFLVQVPETVVAPFVLVPERGADAVRTLHDGVVASVRVRDAQVVEAGDVLFTISSESAGDRGAERTALAANLAGAEDRLANERQTYDNQRLADEQEIERLRQQLATGIAMTALKERQLSIGQEIAARQQRSYEEGLTSWVEASKLRLDADRLAGELEQARAQSVETSAMMRKLQFEMAARKTAFAERARLAGEQLDQTRARKGMLDAETSREGNALTVAAPCAGTIARLHVRDVGSVVRAVDALAEIACRGERLQAELLVPQRGLARARSGQLVKLRFEAFPYQRFGAASATLHWISPMAVAPSPSSAFRALATLDTQELPVDGDARSLRAGMAGQAVVVVGRRSLASHAIEPLRLVRETLSVERMAERE